MAKNVYQRLNEVRKAVPYIKKDAHVQNYQGVTHDMVTAKTRDHLIEHGVMVVPSLVSGESIVVGQTKGGATIIRYEATYQVEFINIDEPSDRVTLNMQAHANDSGDKAPGKAVSYAVKSAILKVLSLETGENDESRVEGERIAAKRISKEQAEVIRGLLAETESDEAAFLKWAKADTVEDIREIAFDICKNALEKKKQ